MERLSAPSGTDQATLNQLISQWGAKRRRNNLRSVYYDGKNALQDFGISLPPALRNINVVLGWPAKACNVLTSRIDFDGFVLPSADRDSDPFALGELVSETQLETILPQAITSMATHSTAFLIATPGLAGEPGALILPKAATDATGIWDARTRTLSDGLSIMATDDKGFPTEFTWYSREHVTTFVRSDGKWYAETQANRLGRVWMEAISYRPELKRPFGHSRISRAVMALTDAGLRVLARSESHAEFFASPQRYALGADAEAFGQGADRWNAVQSRLLTIGKDEDGDLPTLGQFAQLPMTPHFEHLRNIASLFAAEASVPLSSLGIVHDNPSSAEAIYAAKEDLVIEANATMRNLTGPLTRIATTAVMMRDNLTEVPQELKSVQARFRSANMSSPVSAADAIVKQAAVMPWIADSDVALEQLGYSDDQIVRLRADRRRSQGRGSLDALLTRAGEGVGTPANETSLNVAPAAPAVPDDDIKAKADALGILIRAGVDSSSAAKKVGLDGITFTGATPVALRLPETDAARLEDR